MKADKYYGKAARNYDADRCHSLRWANEQRAVADMVFSGPVLDCPLGTGRYAGIYREKGLEAVGLDISEDMIAEAKSRYPDLQVQKGSVLSLPFEAGQFESAVCIRLLDWLYPEQMAKAIAELRRVARTLIVSLRHGEEGERVNYTHSLTKFYEQIGGLFICDRRTTEITKDGTEEIFRLRPPEWQDAIRQFQYHGHTPAFEMYRLAAEWALPFHFTPPVLQENVVGVKAEYWTAEELGDVLDAMARHHRSYATKELPRFTDGPATILQTQGKSIILDGRRRINQWRKMPGRHPVLVIEA